MGFGDFVSGIFGGGKKEKASQNEKFLKDVGNAQIGASKMFEPAHQAMMREANADQSGTIRSRAAGSVWQGLAGDMGANRLAAGDARRQARYEGLGEQALSDALRGGTNSATLMRDETIQAGATSRLSNAQQSGRTARQEARDVAAEAGQKVALANEWANELMGAAVTAGTAGYDRFKTGLAAGKKAQTASGLEGASKGNEGFIYNLAFKRGMGRTG